MPIPQSAFAVLVVVVLLLPGLVYGLVRVTIRGFRADDQKMDSRIAQAMLVSISLDAVYLVVLGGKFSNLVEVNDKGAVTLFDPAGVGWTVLVLGIGVPALLALLLNVRPRVNTNGKGKIRLRFGWLYRSTPTAWDAAFLRNSEHGVRIRMPSGQYVGGWFGSGSYISTYPEPHDIYISDQFEFGKNGEIMGYATDTRGIWVQVPEGAVVEFIAPSQAEGETE